VGNLLFCQASQRDVLGDSSEGSSEVREARWWIGKAAALSGEGVSPVS